MVVMYAYARPVDLACEDIYQPRVLDYEVKLLISTGSLNQLLIAQDIRLL